jgi:hypothetical protein
MLLLPRWIWLNHIPEGLDLASPQRQALRKRLREMGPEVQRQDGVARRMTWHMLGAIGIAVLLLMAWIALLVGAKLSPARFAIANTAGIIVFNIMVWIAIAYGINRGMRPLVWRALNDIGFRVCMSCGYVLHYLPPDKPNCPECGAALHPPTSASP